jgi:rod shape-determining protein MreD
VLVRRIRLVLVVVLLGLLQTELFSSLEIFDAKPDLLLVATAAIAYELGSRPAAIFGFLSGLYLDMFLETPVGLSALSFALTGYVIGSFQTALLRETRGVAPVLGALGGLIGTTIFTVVGGIAGEDGFFTLHQVQIVAVAVLYDAVVAYAVFPLMRWANHEVDIGRTRWR